MKVRRGLVAYLAVFALMALYPIHAHCQANDSAAVHKVNATGALLRSAFVPGWGQFYNGKYVKAGIFAIGEAYLINGIYTDWRSADRHKSYFQSTTDPALKAREFNNFTNARDRRNLKMWILAASIFYSMFDAYVDAQLSDFNQRDRAYEVFLAPAPANGVQIVMAFNIR
jgi:hypothetical protein